MPIKHSPAPALSIRRDDKMDGIVAIQFVSIVIVSAMAIFWACVVGATVQENNKLLKQLLDEQYDDCESDR